MEKIQIEEVSFSYASAEGEGGISEVNLTIHEGECVLLCGRSGCGKTTVTKLVNGLIPHFETGRKTGLVQIDGESVDDMPVYQIAQKAASVFQDPKSQFFNIDTEDEIIFLLENQGISLSVVEVRLKETIDELNLSSLVKKNLFEMSCGERQIIAFACAYATNPDILVLDEPSSNLDGKAVQVIRLILEKLKQKGKTILIADHRFAYLKGLIDTAVYLEQGRIQKVYPAKAFYGLSEPERKAMGLRQLEEPENFLCRKADRSILSDEAEHSLELRNVSVSCGKHRVFEGVSFSLQSGDIAAIVGSNGVGKTTLCRTICGFMESTSGEIRIDGVRLKKKQRLKESYVVMQDTNYQLFAESVLEECLLGNPGVSKKQAMELLEQLDLKEEAGRHPQSLSGGQKQRLSVAVALLAGKKIIILDEPTSGLDYAGMMKVSSLLRHLAESGIIVIVITHDMEFLENTCNRCLELGADGIRGR